MSDAADQVAYQKAHIDESEQVNIIAAISVLTTFSTLAVFLRAYVRWKTGLGFRADDWTIFAAGVSANQTVFELLTEWKPVRSLAPIRCHLLRYILHNFLVNSW